MHANQDIVMASDLSLDEHDMLASVDVVLECNDEELTELGG